jgi:hypothetical protein
VSAAGCALSPETSEPIKIAAALTQRVDPANAPHPSNESEQFLFRQLYETLVGADCEGRVTPGLADSWKKEPGADTWTLTLRSNARFSDSTPLTASDIVSNWTVAASPGAGALRPEVRRMVRSIRAIDERTLEVTLHNQGGESPLALAHTDLAISRRIPGNVWPLGTRNVGVVEGSPGGLSEITLVKMPEPPPTGPFVFPFFAQLRIVPDRDARDLLDEGVDLLVTRDANALGYAASLPQFVSVPLDWQKSYVLLMPGRPRGSRMLSSEEGDALARDAVRGEARGAAGPFWWRTLQGCDAGTPQPRSAAPLTGNVVYEGTDGVARELAERLVGLGRASGPGAAATLDALLPDRPARVFQRATGLTGDALVRSRRNGNDAAYILPLDRRPLDPCREMQVIFERAPWADPETIVPLVDTRLHAIVRRGRIGVTADLDGGLLLNTGDPR